MRWLVAAAVIAWVAAEGTRVSPRDLKVLWRRPELLIRGVLAVMVLVPVLALAVVLLVQPSRRFAVGLSLLAASPLAPVAIARVGRSGDDHRVGASLHVALALLSVVSVPLVVERMGHALHFQGVAPALAIARSVFISVLLPFAGGMAVNALFPARAPLLRKVLTLGGLIVFIVATALVARAAGRAFFEAGPRDYVATVLFCVVALASGHLLAFDDEVRTTFALESAARNPAIALMIATRSFGPVKAAAVLMPYLVIYFLLNTLYTRLRTRRHRSAAPAP